MGDTGLTEIVPVRFTPDDHGRLKKIAEKEDRDVSELIRRWVRQRLDKEGA